MIRKFDIHKKLLQILKKKNPIIVEVGAHFGIDTRRLKENFPDSIIYCFEPDPRCQLVIQKYCNDLDVKLFKYAVSDSNSNHVNFYQSYSEKNIETMLKKYSWIKKNDFLNNRLNRAGASSLKKGHDAVADANVIKTKTIRLDQWAVQNNINHIDLLWVDVQGAEKEVFVGAGKLLKNVDYIWTEYGEISYEGGMTRQETINLLKKDYKVLNLRSFFSRQGELLLKNRRR